MGENTIRVYTDGSWTPGMPRFTYGGVIVCDNDENIIFAQRQVTEEPSLVQMHNVGGELIAALSGYILACQTLNSMCKGNPQGTVKIYHDYVGVRQFIQGPGKWTAKKPGSQMYERMMLSIKQMFPNVRLEFVKVKGHSGNTLNDLADAVANGIEPVSCRGKMLKEQEVK